jgi:hypothetical protein
MMGPFVRLLRAKALLIILAVPVFAVLLLDSAEQVSETAGVVLFALGSFYAAVALLATPRPVFAFAERLAGRPFVVRGIFFALASMMLALAASAFWSGTTMLIGASIAFGVFFFAYIAAISVALFSPTAEVK